MESVFEAPEAVAGVAMASAGMMPPVEVIDEVVAVAVAPEREGETRVAQGEEVEEFEEEDEENDDEEDDDGDEED